MLRIGLASLLVLVFAGTARGEAPAGLPDVDLVRIDKTARTITLYDQGAVVGTIAGIQLGDAPLGHKRFRGDERTPEGRYVIDYGNENSAYHLSLHISYPGAGDRAFAEKAGRDPGGAIFIHGQPNGHAERMTGDWTDGCIAVSNAEIEWLWQVVGDGTVVEIVP